MRRFKDFVQALDGYFMSHFDPDRHNPNSMTREEMVQSNHFGHNDFIPFSNSDTSLQEAIKEYLQNPKRVVIHNDSDKGPAGLVVPKHILQGAINIKVTGMNEINKMRAKVYGSEPREPLSLGKMINLHETALEEHFSRPEHEQVRAEKDSLKRLREAGHISSGKDTLDEGEKTDTVHHETDEHGRTFIAMSAKGIAGHSFYTSGEGESQTHHIINTCAGQTKGCGGGIDAKNVADTSKGTCFAPKAEIQYPRAAIRRHCQTQAMVDPAMSKDWIVAHVGSLRRFGEKADKEGKRALFRPNVLNEMDRGSSAAALYHLNKHRKSNGRPSIISNSYGKTNELHDPENDVHITHSNIGPKAKIKIGESTPSEIGENVRRDEMRVQQTITATNKSGKDLVNRDGNKVPPKNSYMVISAKRDSATDQAYQKATKAIKYWGAGIPEHKWSDSERTKPHEGHFDGEGRITTPDKAHYGHTTVTGQDGLKYRYHYQMQHILHPRLVPVGNNKDGSPHMIPTDSRFKDHEFLPNDSKRFKSPNGKITGAILVTTPTHSTSNEQHHTSFTHHVDDSTVEQIRKNNGVHEIDHPSHQIAAQGREFNADKPEARPMQSIITPSKSKISIIPRPK